MAPSERSASFLAFFRRATQRHWRAATRAHGASGLVAPLPRWLRGATWKAPLTATAIAALEGRGGITYPQDVRRFLATVHTQRRRPSFYTQDEDGTRRINKLYVCFDPVRDAPLIASARDRLTARITEGIDRGALWLEEWGRRPARAVARIRRARDAFAEAPPLIPMAMHTFVVSGADRATTPVFGVHPHDLSWWRKAATWEAYLVEEFADFLGAGLTPYRSAIARAARRAEATTIPFWSGLAAWCDAEAQRAFAAG